MSIIHQKVVQILRVAFPPIQKNIGLKGILLNSIFYREYSPESSETKIVFTN